MNAAAAERTLLMSPQGPRHAVPTIRRHSIKPAQSYTMAKACQQAVRARKSPIRCGFCALPRHGMLGHDGSGRIAGPVLPRRWAGAAGDARIGGIFEVRHARRRPETPTRRRAADRRGRPPRHPQRTMDRPDLGDGARLCAGQSRHPAERARLRLHAVLPAQPEALPAARGGRARRPAAAVARPRPRHPHRPLPLQGVPQRRTGRRADRHRPSTGATIS